MNIEGLKTRYFPEHNYKAVYFNHKTMRLALDPTVEITELDYPEFYDVSITNKCEGGCQYCLVEDSIISTVAGDKKIKDVRIGDRVFNVDTRNMDLKVNTVNQLHNREYCGELIEIELEDGKSTLITPNHKVYIVNKGWVFARDLREGDDVFCLDKP